MKRTEEQILSQAPITVTLGEKEYDIKPLRINPAVEWRKKFVAEVNSVSAEMKKESGTDEAFMKGLGFVLIRFPEKVLGLVEAYAPGLDWATIKDEATEEQVAKVFGDILELAFPFQGELRKMVLLGAAAATSQQ